VQYNGYTEKWLTEHPLGESICVTEQHSLNKIISILVICEMIVVESWSQTVAALIVFRQKGMKEMVGSV